jgi:hypothetical protein
MTGIIIITFYYLEIGPALVDCLPPLINTIKTARRYMEVVLTITTIIPTDRNTYNNSLRLKVTFTTVKCDY